jgi:hypothetical protein
MASLAGKVAGFWRPYGDATTFTDEACTQVGATLEYYITDRTMAWWDSDNTITMKDDGDTEIPYSYDRNGGYVTLSEAATGDITVSGYYHTMEALLGGYGWKLNTKVGTSEVTTFSDTLDSAAAWKSFIGSLTEWSGSVDYHWYTDGETPEIRSSGEDVAKIDDKMVIVFYTDIRTATIMALAGEAYLTAIDANTSVDEAVGGSISFQGVGKLRLVAI